MSDNKFIKHLRGENTAKSVLEIRNQNTPTSFANMPDGTSNANDVYSDHRGNATGVLKGTENWKLNGPTLVESSTIYGDGRDFTNSFQASGNGLWVNTTCSFATEKRFAPNTKFVLKLCGHDLETIHNNTIDFTLIVNFGSGNLISKTFTVTEQAFDFCKEFVIDFAESNSAAIKIAVGDTMQVQLLCSDANAQAVLYNGMTVFTALQRRVDGDAVASDTKTFPEIEQDIEDIYEDIDDLKDYVDDNFVNIDGTSIMTGPLKMRATSDFKCAIAPYWDGIGFFKLNDNNSVTLIASIEYRDSFSPAENNVYNIGAASKKWKNLYLSGKAFVATLNNGGDLTVPANTTGTLATKADVDLAANSGRMITDQGVWYAKMYAATVAPAAENGTNYADFSQTDGQGNPIIVIYERQNGAWVQSETITPPAEYDGYVSITSKIWDIVEQAGQQGGRILWNHQSKEFTPYPHIISFKDAALTGTPTAPTLNANSPSDQIVNKQTLENAIGNGTITITQGGETRGSFTTNQDDNTTINLDAGGSGNYHPDLFDVKWADHICNDVQWLRADTFSWQSGAVYQVAYQHLADDITGKTLQSETISGTTIQFYLADDGHKICPASEESNVAAIYNATGVAWYYIIDTTNQRFKLPRTKFGFTGIRNGVGKFVDAGLPNITGWGQLNDDIAFQNAGGALYLSNSYSRDVASNRSGSQNHNINLDASRSSSIYGNSNTVQPKATEMYLYFYVGNFTQTALENTAGITAETLNDKADIAAVTGLIMPDYARAVDTGLPTYPTSATTATYTCPSNGWFNLLGSRGDASGYTLIVTINGIVVASFPAFTTNYANMFMPVSKGDVIKYVSDNASQTWFVSTKRFIPCKGN